MVSNVDPTMSEAMIWTHPDFRVSAMSEDGSAFGIVQAHAASATTGYLMELRGIPFRSQLKPGALVVSSGLGGVWPRGLPIGTVLQEISTAEGWARTYLLKPIVSPADVGAVMILRSDRVSKGFENVWSSVAAAEAAAQRIVVAGDSAARSAALAEAAARRAAVDTMMRDSLRAPLRVPGGLPPELMPDTVSAPRAASPLDSAAAAARREAARRAAARRDSLKKDASVNRSPTRGI
jgi:rod shape-determining protein MreC